MHEADKYPETRLGDPRATRGVRDVGWVLGVGLAPLLILALTMPAAAIMDRRDAVLSENPSNWNLYAVFGLMTFAPIMVVSCTGALVMTARFRTGRWISTAGNVAMAATMTFLVYASTVDLIAPSEHPIGSWLSALTPVGAALFVVPYLALLAANLYVVRRLWTK